MSLGHILQVFIVLLAIFTSGTCLCAGFFGTDLDYPAYHRPMVSAKKFIRILQRRDLVSSHRQ